MDNRTSLQRSNTMKAVKGKNTGPERVVRRLLTEMGYRYRLHIRDLPGSPDVVFTARRKVIFVNGCFWHGHGCEKGRLPKSNLAYWAPKISRNIERDIRKNSSLKNSGWEVLTIWQCELPDEGRCRAVLSKFLGQPRFFDRHMV